MSATKHFKAVGSIVIQDADLAVAAFKELIEEFDGDAYLSMASALGASETDLINFEDMKIAPRALVIFCDHTFKLGFGGPPPEIMVIRSMYLATYTQAAPLEYIQLINDSSGGAITNIRLIACGDKLP